MSDDVRPEPGVDRQHLRDPVAVDVPGAEAAHESVEGGQLDDVDRVSEPAAAVTGDEVVGQRGAHAQVAVAVPVEVARDDRSPGLEGGLGRHDHVVLHQPLGPTPLDRTAEVHPDIGIRHDRHVRHAVPVEVGRCQVQHLAARHDLLPALEAATPARRHPHHRIRRLRHRHRHHDIVRPVTGHVGAAHRPAAGGLHRARLRRHRRRKVDAHRGSRTAASGARR